MSKLAKTSLSIIIAAVAISSSAPAHAGVFTGTITNDRETVVDHRSDRPNEVVPARRGVDPASLVVVGTPPTGPVSPPSNGGINPIGDVSCFDGQVILFQDGFEVYDSNCAMYIYNFKAISQNVIVDVHMSSFDGSYQTKILGFAH